MIYVLTICQSQLVFSHGVEHAKSFDLYKYKKKKKAVFVQSLGRTLFSTASSNISRPIILRLNRREPAFEMKIN